MQALEAYFENGLAYPLERKLNIIGRRKAIITILDEPAPSIPDNQSDRQAWLDEFHRLLDASMSEDMRLEDFPRTHFSCDLVNFSDEG